MEYRVMERDFIKRTLAVIDQYSELVLSRVEPNDEYQVTLLMNCLLGLLIYPQQLGHKHKWGQWLTNDKVVDVGSEWGIDPVRDIKCAGHKTDKTSITVHQLTMRNLVRQMRNAAAHASFNVMPQDNSSGLIGKVVFHDKESKEATATGQGFHLALPVENLEKFVRKLAESALENIKDE